MQRPEGKESMADIDQSRYAHAGPVAQTDATVDEGLRAYMLRVYNYMAVGIALTGVVAYLLFTMTVTGDPSAAARSATGQALALRSGSYLTPLGYSLFVSRRCFSNSIAATQTRSFSVMMPTRRLPSSTTGRLPILCRRISSIASSVGSTMTGVGL